MASQYDQRQPTTVSTKSFQGKKSMTHSSSQKEQVHTDQVHGLSQTDIKACRIFFKTFDRDGNGNVDAAELTFALQAMGLNPSDKEVKDIMENYDRDHTGKLDFGDFLRALQHQRKNETNDSDKKDLLAAFVAMGGNHDKTGSIDSELLRKVLKDDFCLSIKIDELIEELDTNQDGQISFGEFEALLG